MHSFRPSRGRIFFEVLCAFAVSASCVGAWMQTGATAMLPAAAVAALYGLVHAFDMRRPKLDDMVEPQRIDFATDDLGDVVVGQHVDEPPAAADPQVEPANAAEEAEPEAPPANKGRRTRAPRKGSARRAKVAEEAEVVELPPSDEETAIETAVSEELELTVPAYASETDHPRIEPLFEPDRYFRQKRAAFGRRHTIR